jgi:hypothetical protein
VNLLTDALAERAVDHLVSLQTPFPGKIRGDDHS